MNLLKCSEWAEWPMKLAEETKLEWLNLKETEEYTKY